MTQCLYQICPVLILLYDLIGMLIDNAMVSFSSVILSWSWTEKKFKDNIFIVKEREIDKEGGNLEYYFI